MGFSCWYDQRAGDLTKDGMKHGIEGAAAFLLFLSAGILDRPFCECDFHTSLMLCEISPNLFSSPFCCCTRTMYPRPV
jgi:hypothetical protein